MFKKMITKRCGLEIGQVQFDCFSDTFNGVIRMFDRKLLAVDLLHDHHQEVLDLESEYLQALKDLAVIDEATAARKMGASYPVVKALTSVDDDCLSEFRSHAKTTTPLIRVSKNAVTAIGRLEKLKSRKVVPVEFNSGLLHEVVQLESELLYRMREMAKIDPDLAAKKLRCQTNFTVTLKSIPSRRLIGLKNYIPAESPLFRIAQSDGEATRTLEYINERIPYFLN